MPTLNKPSAGDTDWAAEINDNWTALENQLKNAFQGRLQRDSTTQVSLQRYGGDVVEVNGENVSLGAGGIALATTDNLINSTGGDSGGAMAASTLYYIYVSNSSASYAPSDLRASTTAPSSYNGVKYLGTSGNAANWRFVGYVRTNGSTQFVDSESQRFVINYYNRRPLSLFQCPAYNDNNAETTWTTTSGTYTEANSGTNARVEFIGNGEDAVTYTVVSTGATSPGQAIRAGVGQDSTTTPSVAGTHAPSARTTLSLTRCYLPAEGYRYLALLVKVDTGTGTWYSDQARNGGSSDPAATYLEACVMG